MKQKHIVRHLRQLLFGVRFKIPPFPKRAQAVNPLLAPLKYSTPLCKVCYRKIAGFVERCLFLRRESAKNFIIGGIYKIFSVFHKKITAILGTIRGPPSEI